jgi:Asp-tRNA(Asn)/Glu-tRNA(Gln) amidotransferase A subunit family amidase
MIGWGSDTCGSIRIPATLNNLFGLRPTKGLSSIDGIIPLSHTQDVGGPLARTATDLAIGLDATVGPDPADPFTRVLAERSVPRFLDALDETALRGARLGVLVAAFGEAPEDQAMGNVVRGAVEQMADAGADVSDVDIPNLDSLLSGSSVIAHEFKFDLMDYLAATPGAPVASLQDILELGLHHQQLGERFRRRNEPESRDSEEYRAALAKQAALRDAVIAALEERQLDAIVYPTMRRAAAQIGDPQRGSNCQLSASTGLPALSVPAGFTSDGLPAGVELLGSPFSDARLLAMAYAFERIAGPRRPPPTTPPLEGTSAPDAVTFNASGEDSGVRVTARFVFDVSTGDLSYTVDVFGTTAEQILGITLHRGAAEETGPVLYRLAGPGVRDVFGRVTLQASERGALIEDRLYLSVYTRDRPAGAVRAQLTLPAR